MCGIAGIVALDGFEPRKLVDMTQMIAYRGPSGFGFAYSCAGPAANPEVFHGEESLPIIRRPQIGLGNRRLAILDLSSNGNQPMSVEGGDFCITYNGEIYNYREIRKELKGLGYSFSSGTDTEVVLRSYQAWCEGCLRRFNGMWSFALWDRRKQSLFCSRDRFGVKPFYFATSDRTFYFASEIKQILFALGTKRTANPRPIADFLEWGLQDHLEETSFEGVFQLLGGHFLSLPFRDPLRPQIRSYWELNTAPQWTLSAQEATEEFRRQFERAVTIRLRSDVPVGVSLSGGLDSSAVLCEASRVSPDTRFESFSSCFEDPNLDERRYMSAAASAANSQKHWAYPDAESFWKAADTIAYHQDEPIGGPSVFAQWSVMQAAQNRRVPVLLGGQGGDESLCGYRKYYFFYVWHLLRNFDSALIREVPALARTFANIRWSMGTVARYLPSLARNRVSALSRLATPSLNDSARESARNLGASKDLAERQKLDILISSLPKLLRHEDRNSMAHSIESRMPFLDYELVEFTVRCPPSLKLRGGWTKWILREALRGVLPEEIRLRKSKLGFDIPDSNWLRTGLRNGQSHLWQSPELRLTKFISAKNLSRECTRFLNGSSAALPPEILFRALSVEMWARVHDVN